MMTFTQIYHLTQQMYTYTWKKYLPAIRILLKRSSVVEQTMSLNRTDFEKTTKLRKPSCSFSIEIAKGRVAGVSTSVPGKELAGVLQEDEALKVILLQRRYEISMNNDFLLTIKDITPAASEPVEE
jgi:hypothetical protein